MRWLALLAAVSVVTPPVPLAGQSGRVTGHLTILEKGNKPTPDLGGAVIWLEGIGGAGGPVRPGDFQIGITDKTYAPHVLAVPLGSTVTFPNNDNVRHHVYSFSPAKRFELPLYAGVPAQPVVFDKPGTVEIECAVHPDMKMIVEVSK